MDFYSPYLQDVTLADLFHLPHGSLVADTVGVEALKSDSLPNVKRYENYLNSFTTVAHVVLQMVGKYILSRILEGRPG